MRRTQPEKTGQEAVASSELIRRLDSGGQITSGAQSIYRIKEGEYFLCCDTEGCCDTWMKTDDLIRYINLEPRDWREVPND